jgi:hypothetical protein
MISLTLEWDAIRNNLRFQKFSAPTQSRKQFANNAKSARIHASDNGPLHVAAVEAAVHSLFSTDLGCQRHP